MSLRPAVVATTLPNALCTTGGALGLLPGAAVYPGLAARALAAADGSVWVDAGLCFGPLLLPAVLVLGAVGLQRAWSGAPDAAGWNLRALGAWAGCAAAGAWMLA